MKRWVLLALGLVIGVPGVMALVGAFVPVDHVAATRAVYPQTPDVVWSTLADFESWPDWNPGFERMERGPESDSAVTWIAVTEWERMPLRIELMEAPRILITSISADANLGYSGTWTYELEPGLDGTTVLTLTEAGKIHNPVMRFLARFVMGFDSTQREFHEELGQSFGTDVEGERVL